MSILLQEAISILTERVGFSQSVWGYGRWWGRVKWCWRENIPVNRNSVNKSVERKNPGYIREIASGLFGAKRREDGE